MASKSIWNYKSVLSALSTLLRAFLREALLIFLYAALAGGIAWWMLRGAVLHDDAFFDEVGPVETLQTVFIMISAVLFLIAGRIDKRREHCSVVMVVLFFCMFVRECDCFLDLLIARHAWKMIVTLLLVFLAGYMIRFLPQVVSSLENLVASPAFGVFVSGLIVLIAFSRLFGYGPFWKAIMDNESYRTVKTIVEEGTEVMGYFLILVSSCEYLHEAKGFSNGCAKVVR